MACTFCATGTMGLIRSLTAGEIVEQLVGRRRRHLAPSALARHSPCPRFAYYTRSWRRISDWPVKLTAAQVHASRTEPIRNIVFMGATDR